MEAAPPELTERFLAAAQMAQEVHGDQRRTGSEIPYMAHLLVVTGLVLEDGGDEDQAIAAVLHDSVEDGGGRPMLEGSRRRSGGELRPSWRAARIRWMATQPGPGSSASDATWPTLPAVDDDAILRVALADKVHNARSIVRDYREQGEALWARFPQRSADDQLWYYRGLVEFFDRRRPGPLTEDLWRAVGELTWLVARDQAQRGEQLRLGGSNDPMSEPVPGA